MINEFISEDTEGGEEITDSPTPATDAPATDAPIEGEATNQLEGDDTPAEGGESTETTPEGAPEGTPEGAPEGTPEGAPEATPGTEGGEEGGEEEKKEETPVV